MIRLLQLKIWKPLGEIKELTDILLNAVIKFSTFHDMGSFQMEVMSGIIATMANATIRLKLVRRLRKTLRETSFRYTIAYLVQLSWKDIAVLLRFILMASFNNHGPVKNYVPELFNNIILLLGVGPTIVRESVHSLLINMIQSLCCAEPLDDSSIRQLQAKANELCDQHARVLFGLTKPHTAWFTANEYTTNDLTEPVRFTSTESVVKSLITIMEYAAPTTGKLPPIKETTWFRNAN